MLKRRLLVKLFLETLEDRALPATLISPTTLSFQDVDGDIAAVIFSKPVLADYNVNDVFEFDFGASSVNGTNAQRQKLTRINLVAPFAVDINGADITVRVVSKAANGNGEVHVGEVFSLDHSFGKLNFQGDVNRFTMFNYGGDRKLADSLSVNTTSRFDPEGNSMESRFSGYVESFLVRGDLIGAVIFGYNDNDNDYSVPIIGSMEVHGSLKGSFLSTDRINSTVIRGNIDGTAFPNPYPSSNFIARFAAEAGVGTFTLRGSVLGGTYGGSGQLYLNGTGQSNLGTVNIKGSIRGQSEFSGHVAIYGDYQSITVRGSIIGGAGPQSGILNPGTASSISIHGSIIGGSGFQSGRLSNQTFDPPFTSITDKLQIHGAVIGGAGTHSGTIHMVNPVDQFTLKGAIQGGTGNSSGQARFDAGVRETTVKSVIGGTGIQSGTLSVQHSNPSPYDHQQITIYGSINGHDGEYSGQVDTAGSTLLRIYGSVQGATGFSSGYVTMNMSGENQQSSLHIIGSILGGNGSSSGLLNLNSRMTLVSIRGDLIGNTGTSSGRLTLNRQAGTVTVAGNVKGGLGSYSGSIVSYDHVDSIQIGNSIQGGKGYYSGRVESVIGKMTQVSILKNIVGGLGERSGVLAANAIDSVRVGGSVLGSDGLNAGGIDVRTRLRSVRITRDLAGNFGYVYVGYFLGEGFLDSITVGGNVVSSGIISTGAIGTVTIHGNIQGTQASPSYIISHGAYPPSGVPGHPYLLKSLTVNGSVSETFLVMGSVAYPGLDLEKVQSIRVGKSWTNSVLTIGYAAGADNQYGTEDDVRIHTDEASTIDSLFIGGKILGNRPSTIQAGLIAAVQVSNAPAPLTSGAFNDDFVVSQRLRLWERI